MTPHHPDEPIEDRNLIGLRPLPPPSEVKQRLTLTPVAAETVLDGRAAIRDALHGRDMERLVVIVGPCSIHDPAAALDYAERLRAVAEATRERLVLVMRTYFEKPRTTVGWKGLINDPHLDGSCDLPAGLEMARRILLEINGMGIACAGEMLDPIVPQYIGDLLSWVAIGARTTESQTHREMASGLSMPVGFKNGTDGGLKVALNAMISARHPHSFLGIDHHGAVSVVQTTGNPDRHIVLRGGEGATNYGPTAIAAAAAMVAEEGIARPIMIDCSHDNSGKDHQRQGAVCRAVRDQVRAGERRVVGLMLESNLSPGKQNWMPDGRLAYGVSITDACIGWDETAALLYELADRRRDLRAAS